MDAAYRHGFELSRMEHALDQKILVGVGLRFAACRHIPRGIAKGYSSDDELAAFGAGWIDGAAQYPGMMRRAIEGDDYQPVLN
jgi:hypothetical protein